MKHYCGECLKEIYEIQRNWGHKTPITFEARTLPCWQKAKPIPQNVLIVRDEKPK